MGEAAVCASDGLRVCLRIHSAGHDLTLELALYTGPSRTWP